MTDISEGNALDLDAARKARAAAREGRGGDQPIILGGETIAVLPVELPLDVLEPLRTIEGDVTLLIRQMMTASERQQSQADMARFVVDMLAANPDLPSSLIDTVMSVGRNLLGEDGMAALRRNRITREDAGVLINGILDHFGVSLGESSGPSDSQEEPPSGTSSTTSSTTSTDSTPDESGDPQETPTSLESVGS